MATAVKSRIPTRTTTRTGRLGPRRAPPFGHARRPRFWLTTNTGTVPTTIPTLMARWVTLEHPLGPPLQIWDDFVLIYILYTYYPSGYVDLSRCAFTNALPTSDVLQQWPRRFHLHHSQWIHTVFGLRRPQVSWEWDAPDRKQVNSGRTSFMVCWWYLLENSTDGLVSREALPRRTHARQRHKVAGGEHLVGSSQELFSFWHRHYVSSWQVNKDGSPLDVHLFVIANFPMSILSHVNHPRCPSADLSHWRLPGYRTVNLRAGVVSRHVDILQCTTWAWRYPGG